MKKILSIVILFLFLYTTVYAADIPEIISVHDYSDVLSPTTEKYIFTQNEELSKTCGAKIVFHTADIGEELSVNEYATQIFEEWGVGKIGRSNSVFVFMCPQKRDYTVIVADGISAALTKIYANECLSEYMEPDFAKKDYDEAAVKTYNALATWYNDNYNKVSLSLTEDLSEYDAIVDYEQKVIRRKTIWTTVLIIFVAGSATFALIYFRRKMRMDKLRKRRLERKRRYMRARQKTQ